MPAGMNIGLLKFQSTLPLRGATRMPAGMNIGLLKFQFTLPLRGVTDVPRESNACFVISIHTPLARSDAASAIARPNGPKISIHTPLAGSDVRS